ncbi:MAG: hypothetical protein HY321_02055 [Armatimonadetes bacterium]|nr:hypothetical protein [Armatimonadota bacterium]
MPAEEGGGAARGERTAVATCLVAGVARNKLTRLYPAIREIGRETRNPKLRAIVRAWRPAASPLGARRPGYGMR